MRIVQLITHMNELGGAQVHVRDLSRQLITDGHEVTIMSGGEETTDSDLVVDGIAYVRTKFLRRNINLWKDVQAILEIRKKLKELSPDIVAIHSSKAGILGRIACWSLRLPFVFTAHGWAFAEGVETRKKMFYRLIEKQVGKLSRTVITVCEQDRLLAINNGVLPSEKLVTITNGVHDNSILSNRTKKDEVVIVMVARFEAPKKHLDVIKALAQIKDLQWKMIFVGDGSLKQEVMLATVENELDNRVFFLGNCSDVSSVLKNSDLFVLTSSWEGLPLSILEAMMHSLPVISSDVGGVKEAVSNNKNGFLIKDNLSDLLKRLIEDEELRLRMGKKSRNIYLESFTFSIMYEKTCSVYHKVINKKELL
ncbi:MULTISPECIES: glycosyltransferase family 4 protein [Psychrobacillus]|uniref:Glycosyltransferase family 4 protein n=1 Tax=Psychrobacillus faecigallinarum TaxID=2762235 RepID=A0ABR8RDG5_9BACI|nr:glycosyltransferase family 4 protein [Psychrobacillus faecigallinarum]MBD7945775.1 glycosyltransferase family 4 protein [Psychrobacillus faecigallinarum]QGM29366.1 glycosyltransferase [Bacillus sp. N3536]